MTVDQFGVFQIEHQTGAWVFLPVFDCSGLGKLSRVEG